MVRRIGLAFLMATLAFSVVACHNKKIQNPLANLGSKQPDVVLFDRAMDELKHNKFDQGRMLLQTLINAYPDSEYIARAKLAIGDSWYAEGGSAAMAQAENEYKDFITFFPNMPEAAEAQMKIANIHYRQMEKPDRDFTHAKRAEEEYRTMILQFPDSKLVPEATQRLREVQEVLADREFGIGRFYFLRESWAASIARLQSMVDTYPLYSGADEALYMLGNAYERQYDAIKAAKLNEAVKERLGKEFADKAAEAYGRIVTRYPVMARSDDAKHRLEVLGRPIPKPTEVAIAQNKAEEQSRSETGRFDRMMLLFRKHPDMAQAAKVGDPTLADTQADQRARDRPGDERRDPSRSHRTAPRHGEGHCGAGQARGAAASQPTGTALRCGPAAGHQAPGHRHSRVEAAARSGQCSAPDGGTTGGGSTTTSGHTGTAGYPSSGERN